MKLENGHWKRRTGCLQKHLDRWGGKRRMLHMKAAIHKKLTDEGWLQDLWDYAAEPAIVCGSPSAKVRVVA
jgi:hypothetical protein